MNDRKPKLWLRYLVLAGWCANLCFGRVEIAIGALFDQDRHEIISELAFEAAIYYKNLYNDIHFVSNIQYISSDDIFNTGKTFCNMTNNSTGVVAVFGPLSPKTATIVQSASKHLEIPHIQFNERPSPTQSQTTINLHPDMRLVAQSLAALMRRMDWKSYTILYESKEGLIRLQEVLKLTQKTDNPVTVRQIGPGNDYRPLLKQVKNSTDTNVILDCHVDRIIEILKQAKMVRMLEIQHSYLLTSLDAHTLDFNALEASANITTIRIVDPENHEVKMAVNNWNHYKKINRPEIRERYGSLGDLDLSPNGVRLDAASIYDAANILMDSILELQVTGKIKSAPLSCEEGYKWDGGLRLVEYMKVHELPKATTIPATFEDSGREPWFNEDGKRTWFQVQVVEIINGVTNIIAVWDPSLGKHLNVTRSASDQEKQIVANLQKTVVIVSSRLGPPYLSLKKEANLEGNARYEGYSMDLIAEIAKELNFTFKFELAKDEKYGKYNPKTKSWDGLIKDLLDGKAHLAICDLTITHSRREVVDFSMPFMTLGVSILFRKPDKQGPNIFAFMDPLEFEVWIYIATLYLGTSIALYFIARMAPGDWENPHPCNQNPDELENIWGLKNCLWLNLGSIMQQGCDILPKGISSRMGASMWWFFSLIITSSYTANLAAFLTTERMGPQIDSAEALSKQTKIKYGLVEGGATEAFFSESNFSTYQRMWVQMKTARPSVFEKSNMDGVKRVLSNKNLQYAFLMESSTIEYEIERNCDLKQVGTRLDNKGYGIAMPVNSPYRSAINAAVLKLQENGKLNYFKDKWWKHGPDVQKCEEGTHAASSTSELALANVGGVFLVLGVGIAMALGIAIMEFLWNVHNVSVEEHITYWEALILEVKFAVNVCNTEKRVKPIIDDSSSSSGQNSETKSVAQRVLQGASSFMNLEVFDKISMKKQR